MIEKLIAFCVRHRIAVTGLLVLITAALGISAFNIQIRTVFSDLMPQDHAYIKTHEQFKTTFGGSNMVSIMLEVDDKDETIFQIPVLTRIKEIQDSLQFVSGVNQFQIISLAASKLREVRASSQGIETRPLMWPDLPETQDEINNLRDAVLENTLVYGRYVSRDLNAALITVDFIDRLVDYDTNFAQIRAIIDDARYETVINRNLSAEALGIGDEATATITATLADRPDGESEYLDIKGQYVPIGLEISGLGTKEVSISGTAKAGDFVLMAQSLTYRNEAEQPGMESVRTIDMTITEGEEVRSLPTVGLRIVPTPVERVTPGEVGADVDVVTDYVLDSGITYRVVGDPILFGWINYYLPQTLLISALTLGGLFLVLFFLTRSWRGSVLPLLSGVVSAIWALGIANMMGYNFDPLAVVLAFLITARAISHSVQLINRFDQEYEGANPSPKEAAQTTLNSLFRPGMLGLATDAGAMLVVSLTPIPILEKIALVGTMWLGTIAITAFIMTPVLLSWVWKPGTFALKLNTEKAIHVFMDGAAYITNTRGHRLTALAVAGVIFVVSGIYATNIKVGDANPGSPILWQDHEYNKDWNRINEVFQGSDRMFVVVKGEDFDALKEPVVLANINRFQRYMEAMPEIGGSIALTDVVPIIKRQIFEGNPHYEELGDYKAMNGELMYLFVSGSSPGDLDRYSDARFQNGAVTFFFRDRQGDTIRNAIGRIKEFVAENPMISEEGDTLARYQLAGGLIGVLAAVNEVILQGQIQSIALALLIVVLLCAGTYRSATAGMFFMVPILLSNTVTFSFMAYKGIGMNINTVPVAALGIGLGVDYAIYIIDMIKQELKRQDTVDIAVRKALHGCGRAVFVTALTLIVAMLTWLLSDLRFQAEMGELMALWLGVSATAALVLMPSMAVVLKPKFIFEGSKAAVAD